MRTLAFHPIALWACLLCAWCTAGVAHAGDADLCRSAISSVESRQRIPDAFLSAIARVESGRPDGGGTLAAWPWTINAEGTGAFFASKSEAIAAVRALQARGVRSIDVGCLQVNLMHHPEAFASLEQAFDPEANATFAGAFLISLFDHTGSWPLAAAAYHSQTPTVGAAYQRRVLAEWAVPDDAKEQAPAGPARQAINQAPHRASAQEAAPANGRLFGPIAHAAPSGGMAFTGRSLAAYRAMPTRRAG